MNFPLLKVKKKKKRKKRMLKNAFCKVLSEKITFYAYIFFYLFLLIYGVSSVKKRTQGINRVNFLS